MNAAGACVSSYIFISSEETTKEKEKYKVVNNELDATFAELTGF